MNKKAKRNPVGKQFRDEKMSKIRDGSMYDLLVIGCGITGAGVALEASMRGMRVACVDKRDIGSMTSSTSTKLIWGGSRYLLKAIINLFNSDLRLIKRPIETIQTFFGDFLLVLQSHQERAFLLETQPHLFYWLPIAVPLTQWLYWPPPLGFIPAAFSTLGLLPIFFFLVFFSQRILFFKSFFFRYIFSPQIFASMMRSAHFAVQDLMSSLLALSP
jgi:hypothetical protein